MTSSSLAAPVTIIGGGVVGVAILHTLVHRGIDVLLLEAEPGLGLAASGTNSGILHTGFDSTPGERETDLILRSAALRPAVMESLNIPVLSVGAVLLPQRSEDAETIRDLAENASRNGVEVHIRESDGALVVPGESVTDPVAFTLGLAQAAQLAGARIELNAEVVGILQDEAGLTLELADGRRVTSHVVVNAAGLHADDIAKLVGDESFEIYPRKGEFFVYKLPEGQTLDHIVLPVPTKRTKGVLVVPTVDGHVIIGPTAIDLMDKNDWSVGPGAFDEIHDKAIVQWPELEGLELVASYAGLRPAGRDTNYRIGSSPSCSHLVNVAAIRSTGLSASLGIAAYVADLLPPLGIELGPQQPLRTVDAPQNGLGNWWKRTATHQKTMPSSTSSI